MQRGNAKDPFTFSWKLRCCSAAAAAAAALLPREACKQSKQNVHAAQPFPKLSHFPRSPLFPSEACSFTVIALPKRFSAAASLTGLALNLHRPLTLLFSEEFKVEISS